jgi:Domain of unknown function (DUF4410)
VKPAQFCLLLLAVLLAPAFTLAQLPNRQPGGPPSASPTTPNNEPDAPPPSAAPERSKVIYIADFELDSADASADSRQTLTALGKESDSLPPINAPTKTVSPTTQAHHIEKVMSDNLLKDFAKAGYTAKLLHASDPRPDDGILIEGVFAEVAPDNRLRRAVLGGSLSSATWQIYVAAKDFAHFTAPLYSLDPADPHGDKPGAVIVLNPNADAAKFSVEADPSDKTIKQTAQRITADLVKRIAAAAKSENEPLNRYAKP